MGVSGSGKTTLAAALAQRLRVPFADADDFHPAANVGKMAAGEPLDDADRMPWLDAIGAWLGARPSGGVVACSALRRSYRDRLRGYADGLRCVHVHGDREVIERRVASRTGHFMPPELLDSQLETLEPLDPDEAGFVVDVDQPVDDLVDEVLRQL